MTSRPRLVLSVLAVVTTASAGPPAAGALAGPAPAGAAHSARVCAAPPAGSAACHALVRTDGHGTPVSTTTPAGYGPADLRSAYGLGGATGGSTQTVGIVDAYDDPNAAADLATYRSHYGLPPCTADTGCFRKVDQNGGNQLPKANGGWAQEISLDLDMVSAVCPNCHILLVEASSAGLTSLGTAVNTAVRLGATEVSNSYGGGESAAETGYDTSYFQHPGVPITASSGDSGYGVQYPAASPFVTAVGGTTLNRAANSRGWAETAWSGAGSGCSAYEPQQSWQAGLGSCPRRTVADVSADADPATGVAVYDSYAYHGSSGWLVFGGTSVASPVIAGVYALAGNGAAITYGSYPYGHTGALNDVTSGSNGSCAQAYLCTAGPGYDGPTGLGTPNGTGAF